MTKLLVVAGDPSGDLHGANLIGALKRREPGLRVTAVGGPLMKSAADDFMEDLASRGVTGFWEPAAKLGFLVRLALKIKRFLRDERPKALVCIDYYGFNRRVLGLAKAAGVPSYYYISPQVWASRPGRIKTLKALVRKMFVIFPFEEKLYREAGVPCRFVGHPLLDLIPAPAAGDGPNKPLQLGLLPGSRTAEIKRHLPIFLEASRALRRHFPGLKVLVFASPSLPDSAYADLGDAELVRESDYRKRAVLDLVLCSSGTATLENALLGLPMVVVYKMSWPTYAVARAIVRVRHIAMANILAGKSLVPELIQSQATAGNVAGEALRLLEDPRRRARLREDLLALRASLGRPGAAERAAEEILASPRIV